MMSAAPPALLVPPVRLGRLLRDARQAQGHSLVELSRLSGFAIDEGWLAEVEAGGVVLDERLVGWLTSLYGVPAETLVPERARLVLDLEEGRVCAGGRCVDIVPSAPDHILANYVSLVTMLRGLEPGAAIRFRAPDLAVLAEALSLDEADVLRRLTILARSRRTGVAASLLRRRVVFPVAGVVVGLTVAGALLLVRSPDADRGGVPVSTPDPASVDGPEVSVEIGDAVVIERGGEQRVR
jgi:transcriptional regulator with XRE-family HTH domain